MRKRLEREVFLRRSFETTADGGLLRMRAFSRRNLKSSW
jgi:hypothetical protein